MECPNCQLSLPEEEWSFCPKCRFPLQALAGKYRFEKKIGQGGFGEVFLATHTFLGLPMVIKTLRPEAILKDKIEELKVRFKREARLTAQLSQESDHIVQIMDVGEDKRIGHYYIMEYLRGVNLEDFLKRHGPLSYSLLFHIFEQICEGIACAHQRGIIHRDLKPANIFLVERANENHFVKIIDFGIAKALQGTLHPELTRKKPLGTPAYMAPEQCSGGEAGTTTDVYALGCILYEMLSGSPPFVEKSQSAMLIAHLMHTPEPIRQRRAGREVPEYLEKIVLKALSKKPEERFFSVEVFWQEIQSFLVNHPECMTNERMPAFVYRGESQGDLIASDTVIETQSQFLNETVPSLSDQMGILDETGELLLKGTDGTKHRQTISQNTTQPEWDESKKS